MSAYPDKNKYSFVQYNENWPKRFREIKSFLEIIFGTKALRIEHVGSTAVPGMMAKPIIDVLVEVERIQNLGEETKRMVSEGYEWKENYIAPDTFLFFRVNTDGEKTENIHICEATSPMVRKFLVLRDFFRTFPDKAQAYADVKKANAERYPQDYPAYREAKHSFVEQMQKEAYEWENKSSVLRDGGV